MHVWPCTRQFQIGETLAILTLGVLGTDVPDSLSRTRRDVYQKFDDGEDKEFQVPKGKNQRFLIHVYKTNR